MNPERKHLLMQYPTEKTVLFIDGANLFAASRGLDFEIDFKQLLREFSERSHLLRAYYYTCLFDNEEFSPIRPLADWLEYNGFQLRTRNVQDMYDNAEKRRQRASLDAQLCVDAMELAPIMDHAVFFTGEACFIPVLNSLKRHGVRCTVISTIQSSQFMISDDLRRAADRFIELQDLSDIICRPLRTKDED